MKPRAQILVSAVAVPSLAFIALNRWATGHLVWAAVWAFIAVMHGFMLVDAIRTAAQSSTDQQG